MNTALAILACVSFVLTLWRWVVSWRFPLHERRAPEHPLLPITLLKPLKGADAETRHCLRSWLNQDYNGPVQILFGVASEADPVCDVVRGLLAEFPRIDAQLVICPEPVAANRKVSTLMQLEPKIRHAAIVVSDADVSVPSDFLANIAPLLSEPGVGLVNCFYRLANPSTVPMHWEAIAVNADFWSQVLQARSLKEVDFALGAVMALPHAQLAQIGGFSALASFLADDYQLGQQVVRNAGRIVFSPVVVDCWESSLTWKQAWGHQLRWARTIRVCQPFPFFLSVLSNATLWPLLWILARLICDLKPSTQDAFLFGDMHSVWTIVMICFCFRIGTALDLQRRIAGSNASLKYWWLIPIKDVLNVVIWGLSFAGNNIEWRGQKYRVVTGGKLVKLEPGT